MKPPLWAPWRMEYILSAKDKSRCVLCDAAAASDHDLRERRVLVVADHATVLLNTFPFAAGHLLVIPNRHIDDIARLSDTESTAFWELARESCARLRIAVDPQGLNIGMNLGAAAGAGIAEHVHWHIVPRWVGDMNFMPVVADIHVMPQHLDATWCKLYAHFGGIPGRRAPRP